MSSLIEEVLYRVYHRLEKVGCPIDQQKKQQVVQQVSPKWLILEEMAAEFMEGRLKCQEQTFISAITRQQYTSL